MTATKLRTLEEQIAHEDRLIDNMIYQEITNQDLMDDFDEEDGYYYQDEENEEDYDLYDEEDWSME